MQRKSRWMMAAAIAAASGLMETHSAVASPHIPASDAQVLAEIPAGARHVSGPAQTLTETRLDIALPLAQLDISRARTTGDLRFLGYAEAILSPWLAKAIVAPQVLILHATILQSRHAFDASLQELDRGLKARPDDAQGWLTRATVLRVLGRYEEALASCEHLSGTVEPAVTSLCVQSLRGLMGHLKEAYAAVVALPTQQLPSAARAWRYSELGEMAERLGNDEAAEVWLREGVRSAPEDFYMRLAYADLMLRHGRAAETLDLLAGFESMEPMLLRMAIAHQELRDDRLSHAEEQLTTAFDLEQRRGDPVHRREQARFLLDVEHQPLAALEAAQENWQVQREPDDVLILLRAAQAAHRSDAETTALRFLRTTGLEDARLPTEHGAT